MERETEQWTATPLRALNVVQTHFARVCVLELGSGALLFMLRCDGMFDPTDNDSCAAPPSLLSRCHVERRQ